MKKLFAFACLALSITCCQYKETTLSPNSGTYSTRVSDNGIVTNSIEKYNEIIENPFVETKTENTSTFSIDADGASYANVRRFLNSNQKPPADAVRTEELINYFHYNYDNPNGEHPVAVNGEVSSCPWNTENKLVRIGLKGKTTPKSQLLPSNIVLLIDVSGSMGSADKLPLLKEALEYLVDEFRSQDKIAIVTYAGDAGVVLKSTAGSDKSKIKNAIKKLGSGGSTAGAKGIITAYEIAQKNFVKDGNNRVILMSDGDFNVGPSSQTELVELIEKEREYGIFLTVIGVGTGNLNDAMMEQIADKGNGIYEYIDNIEQAKKVFVYEFNKFYSVAKDVKIQVQFNKELVKSYRLIGYENRKLENKDFTNDKKDAGDLSDSQTITALYEIVPQPNADYEADFTFKIDFRYKNPNQDFSKELSLLITDNGNTFEKSSENMRWASTIASYGMLLRNSAYKGNTSYDKIISWAKGAKKFDPNKYREEFINLVEKTKKL